LPILDESWKKKKEEEEDRKVLYKLLLTRAKNDNKYYACLNLCGKKNIQAHGFTGKIICQKV
jgi:hypothetical protein